MEVMTEYSVMSVIVILIGLSILLYSDVSFTEVITYLTISTSITMLGVTAIGYWMNENNCLYVKKLLAEWLD